MDEDALKQINRLAFENGRMRFLIGEAVTTMLHAETFIRTREKMHRTGIDLWCELVSRLQELLDDQMEMDEIELDDSPFCECGNDPYEEEAASGVCSACGKELS